MKKKTVYKKLVKMIKKVDEDYGEEYEILSEVSFIVNGKQYTFDKEGNEEVKDRKPTDVVRDSLANEDSFLMVYDGGMMYSMINDEFGYGGLHEKIDEFLDKNGYYLEPIYSWCGTIAKK